MLHTSNPSNSSWITLSLIRYLLPQMDASISKADASKHTGQVHVGSSLQILRVPYSSAISQQILTWLTIFFFLSLDSLLKINLNFVVNMFRFLDLNITTVIWFGYSLRRSPSGSLFRSSLVTVSCIWQPRWGRGRTTRRWWGCCPGRQGGWWGWGDRGSSGCRAERCRTPERDWNK